MAAAAGGAPARLVCVTRFGSHRCGCVVRRPGPGAPARPSAAARAGLTQKTLAKKFDFPIPLNETSKIMKKKKKVSAWNKVLKVIARMLEENEKYRLRLKCQQLSGERLTYLWICLPKKILKSLKIEL